MKSLIKKFLSFLFLRLQSGSAHADSLEDKLALVRYMIKKGNFTEAAVKLKLLLIKNPFAPAPFLLLARIYDDHLDQKMEAEKWIEHYFGNSKLRVSSENIELLARYSDICRKLNKRGQAVALLEHESKRGGYSEQDKNRICILLDSVKSEIRHDQHDGNTLPPPVEKYQPSKISNKTYEVQNLSANNSPEKR